MRTATSKRGLVIVDTFKSVTENSTCDLNYDLVQYTGSVVFEIGQGMSRITIEIKLDAEEEEDEFFDLKIGSIHKRIKRQAANAANAADAANAAKARINTLGEGCCHKSIIYQI